MWDDAARQGPSLSEILKRQQSAAPPPAEPAAASIPAEPSNIEAVDPANLPVVWQQLLLALASHGPALRALLAPGRYAGLEEDAAVLRFPASNQTFVKMLERNGKKEVVRDALSAVLGRKVSVRFEVTPDAPADAVPASPPPPAPAGSVPPAPPTPAAAAPPALPPTVTVRLTPELKAELENDPLIRAIITELNGGIVKVE